MKRLLPRMHLAGFSSTVLQPLMKVRPPGSGKQPGWCCHHDTLFLMYYTQPLVLQAERPASMPLGFAVDQWFLQHDLEWQLPAI
jgi:hypothetical protein